VITASRQNVDAAPDIHHVPDDLADIWHNPKKQKLSRKAHLERLIRRVVFPGEVGILWSIDAAKVCRQLVAQHRNRPVVVFSTFPPTGPLLVGLILAMKLGVPWISDFRDPMAIDPTLELWPWFTRFVLNRLERLTFRRAAALIANVEGAAEIWRRLYPLAETKLHVVWNGFDPEDQPQAAEITARTEKVLIHAGTLYEGRNPNQIIQSLGRLRTQGVPTAHNVRVLLLGDVVFGSGIDQSLCDQAAEEGWLDFRAAVPRAEARRLTEEADSLLLLQPQTAIQVPGKLFEYICIGRPVLALAPRGSGIEYILERAAIPYVCLYPDDSPEVTDQKMRQFLLLPSTPVSPSDWFRDTFDGKAQAGQLASIIDSLVFSWKPPQTPC
jgi:glycosyltransferase involved in cell wall biosynthesis